MEDATYYLVVYIDVDGDGHRCAGDFRPDYDMIDGLAEVYLTPPEPVFFPVAEI